MTLDESNFLVRWILGRCFIVMISGDAEEFYACFTAPSASQCFRSFGQALAAVGHFLDGEFEKIKALRSISKPLYNVRVIFFKSTLNGPVYILEVASKAATGEFTVKFVTITGNSSQVFLDRAASYKAAQQYVAEAWEEVDTQPSAAVSDNEGSFISP